MRSVVKGSSRRLAERRTRWLAAVVAALYVAAGLVWILLTDIALYHFVDDPIVIARFETAKGWMFVGLTAVLLYAIVKRTIRNLAYSEATTHAIIDSIADGVLILAPDGSIVGVNPAAARMLGAGSPAELIGMEPEEFARRFRVSTDAGVVVAPERYVSQRALTGEQPPPYRAHLFPPGRDELVIMATGAPVRATPVGPVEAAVSVMHDITQIENLARLREQFFASAAHALKTPIAIIKAHVYLVTQRFRSSERALEVLDRQCGKLDRLAENLLASVRVRTGTLSLDVEPVDWAAVVEEVTRDMAHASADHRLTGTPAARPEVWADRDRLAQVLRTTIEIAYRRARPGSEVRIGLTTSNGRARFDVSYLPLPIEAALGQHDGAGYTGLELDRHVVESLVEAMGGTVRSDEARDPERTDIIELPTAEKAPAHA